MKSANDRPVESQTPKQTPAADMQAKLVKERAASVGCLRIYLGGHEITVPANVETYTDLAGILNGPTPDARAFISADAGDPPYAAVIDCGAVEALLWEPSDRATVTVGRHMVENARRDMEALLAGLKEGDVEGEWEHLSALFSDLLREGV